MEVTPVGSEYRPVPSALCQEITVADRLKTLDPDGFAEKVKASRLLVGQRDLDDESLTRLRMWTEGGEFLWRNQPTSRRFPDHRFARRSE